MYRIIFFGSENYFEVGVAELGNDLSAHTAGRAEGRGFAISSADYRNSLELGFALADGFENRRAFGAVRGSLGGVFYITPCVNLSALC